MNMLQRNKSIKKKLCLYCAFMISDITQLPINNLLILTIFLIFLEFQSHLCRISQSVYFYSRVITNTAEEKIN